MPTNRTRRTRAHQPLDSLKMGELWYGPGTCLILGSGYCHDTQWDDTSPAERHAIIEQMKDDWQRNRHAVLAGWAARDEHQLYLARSYGTPTRPWAERFDNPNMREKNQ